MKNWVFIFFFLLPICSTFSQEICDNGIDDDLDGLIDLNDTTDCDCNIGVLPQILPNPSFEDFSACPTQASQMARVNNWMDALAYNSPDYFNCGYRLASIPFPFPHGNGIVGFAVGNGNAKEFFGACLLDTLHPGKTYQIEFDYSQIAAISPRPIAVYGSNSCTNLPYPRTPIGGGGTTANCPSFNPNWATLDTLIPIVNNNSWNTYTFEFSPSFPITTLVFGPSCSILNSPAPQAYYGAMDNLRLSYISPTVSISSSGHICKNNLVLTAQFDSTPQSIQWYRNGIALINDTSSSLSISPGTTGVFRAKLNFVGDCLLSDSFLIDSPNLTVQKDSTGSCANKNDGTISLFKLGGGTKPFQFSINGSRLQNDSNFINLAPGLHQIVIRDSNECQLNQSVRVNSYPVPVSSFYIDTVCFGQISNLVSNSFLSGGSIASWNWNSPIHSQGKNTSFLFPNSGANPVTLTTVSDSGCIDDTTINVWVRELPKPNFIFSPSIIYTYSPEICFTNISNNTVSQLWKFGFTGPGNTDTAFSPCPVILPNQFEQTLEVTLISIDKFGCMDSVKKPIDILEDFLIFIPNSFSPNDDGTNDVLFPVLSGIESIQWQIFNRWGELIFETQDTQAFWNGTHSGINVPIGSYPYRMKIKSNSGQSKEITGEINVIR